ncbi:hypothetical protein PMAYCL1PPCAC_26389, partial [Pristionchus mayeri]
DLLAGGKRRYKSQSESEGGGNGGQGLPILWYLMAHSHHDKDRNIRGTRGDTGQEGPELHRYGHSLQPEERRVLRGSLAVQ